MIRWADKDGDGQVMEAILMMIIMIMMVIIMTYIQVSHMYHIHTFSFMVITVPGGYPGVWLYDARSGQAAPEELPNYT